MVGRIGRRGLQPGIGSDIVTRVIAGNWLRHWSDLRLLGDHVRVLGVGEVCKYMHTPSRGPYTLIPTV